MSIILTFVEPATTADDIESAFEDTFGNVLGRISLSGIKQNSVGNAYRTATLEFSSTPSDLQRWIKVIRETGSNSLCYKKNKYWTARMMVDEHPKSKGKPKISF